MAEPKQVTPVRVRPSRRTLFKAIPLLQGSKSKSSLQSPTDSPSATLPKVVKHRSEKIEIETDDFVPFLEADSGGFCDEVECSDEKAKKKKKRGSFMRYLKSFAGSKKSRSVESTIEEENYYERAIRRAEGALTSLRCMRYSIGEADHPWDASEYHQHIQRLHKMDSRGGVQEDAAAATDSSEQQLEQAGGPSLAEWLQLMIDTVEYNRRGFFEEVDELRCLLWELEEAKRIVSSIDYFNLIQILHHLQSRVVYDEEWAKLIVNGCRMLHKFKELRRIVILLVLMTSPSDERITEQDAEHIRTLILRETVGECTQWVKLLEWQRDIICCLLMRRQSSKEKKHAELASSASLRERASTVGGGSSCTTLPKTSLTRRSGMRPDAEDALRDAGIMDAKCREVMEAAAKDLGLRLEMESVRAMTRQKYPITLIYPQ
ncbi:hypothetical protein PMAYCL1PPCAC_26720 [Pristionchus mayeri]|uniref:Uncharacterized protein n=1 Tax=Pristionchus mayeri TaxID=1317129 RepID=A0AAN5D5T1_9BILA|nr:hypothetical protein PMAYCL1PPCAC_26720 [Pristionchus mayeri]